MCEFCESTNPTIVMIQDQSKETWVLDWVVNFTFSKDWNSINHNFKKFNYCPMYGRKLTEDK